PSKRDSALGVWQLPAYPLNRGYDEYPPAEADRGRHQGFPSFNVFAGGPGSLAERSATEGTTMAGINYLFPPDRVLNLPTWRFVLHFEITPAYKDEHRQQAITALKAAQWKIVTFPFGLDTLA